MGSSMNVCMAWIAGITLSCVGCATVITPYDDVSQTSHPSVMGRIVAVIMGESSRIYEPEIRSFELEDQQSHERFTVKVQSDDRQFAITLRPGDYRLIRVQINEGPFMSMAEMNASFSVDQESLTYVGTWRFGVDIPKYGRMLSLSMVMDATDRAQVEAMIAKQYPLLEGIPLVSVLPDPPTLETRLYEVMPYPRYPSYFRRHNW